MRIEDKVCNEYFEWLFGIVNNRMYKKISYRRLLMQLHNTEFRYSIERDENRAEDGKGLRDKFADAYGYSDIIGECISGPCSVLEMMIALSIRCESTIMDDPTAGDRTGQWFWNMIVNLGLGSMTDDRFDREYVENCISRFLDREYEYNGEGGLFTVDDPVYDMRAAEIWYQLCWYLDSIIGEE